MANPIPKQHSLFRLITDQARIDDDVLNYDYEGSGTTEDPYVVTWIPDDAGNPMNWNRTLKWVIAITAAVECFATAFSSSAFSGTIRELVAEFHASTTLLTAGISLFVLGFALGKLKFHQWLEIMTDTKKVRFFGHHYRRFTAGSTFTSSRLASSRFSAQGQPLEMALRLYWYLDSSQAHSVLLPSPMQAVS